MHSVVDTKPMSQHTHRGPFAGLVAACALALSVAGCAGEVVEPTDESITGSAEELTARQSSVSRSSILESRRNFVSRSSTSSSSSSSSSSVTSTNGSSSSARSCASSTADLRVTCFTDATGAYNCTCMFPLERRTTTCTQEPVADACTSGCCFN